MSWIPFPKIIKFQEKKQGVPNFIIQKESRQSEFYKLSYAIYKLMDNREKYNIQYMDKIFLLNNQS